jgi:hypothetical protein
MGPSNFRWAKKMSREEYNAYVRDRYKSGTVERNARYMKAYGITLDAYNELLSAQGGTCAICKKANENGRQLAVDHDHATGAVRGLLCSPCNTSLGGFGDNRSTLIAAIPYLDRHYTEAEAAA